MNLGYKVKKPLTHIDIRYSVESNALRKQGQTISLEDMAYKTGQNIVKQKHRFLGRENGPVKSENLGHILDLVYVPASRRQL